MITQIHVENYKSLYDFTMDVGRFNVLIGENGCGKSNILEAITLAGAARADKLDKEFLVPRGIRVTEPQFMRSAFQVNQENISIAVQLENVNSLIKYDLANNNKPYSEWKVKEPVGLLKVLVEKLRLREVRERIKKQFKIFHFGKFIIYSPENTALRNFEKEIQIQPLGINGQGLLKLLKVIQQKSIESTEKITPFDEIKQSLELFDWYEDMDISSDFSQLEQKITIKDQYLNEFFDQRSANEGFLFVLFYIALMVSDDTPDVFAIDNIDASLNPKLCTKLITELTRLAKKYNKQVFVTTHNPAILDGIDLGDDEQRLLVISRNRQGHTRCKRIGLDDKPKSSVRAKLVRVLNDNETYTKQNILNKFDNSKEPLKLSEAFLRDYLGGLPDNF
ncbi:MAG: AAA family ATPase [Methylococcales bacterium]|nr:AAA family ATPase [Methylococcales bacterium]